MIVNSWTNVVMNSLQNVWGIIASFLPDLLGAIIVVIIGLFVAWIFEIVSEKIVDMLKIDLILNKVGVEKYFSRAGIRLKSGRFVGKLVYWFFVVATALAVSDILGLWGFSTFLNEVLVYFPNIIVAALILLASIVIANFLRGLVKASVKSAKLNNAKFLGTITWWITVIFGIFAALLQLKIAESVVNALVIGFIAMLSLAGGLAFGLGGRDYAAHIIQLMRRHTEERSGDNIE